MDKRGKFSIRYSNETYSQCTIMHICTKSNLTHMTSLAQTNSVPSNFSETKIKPV